MVKRIEVKSGDRYGRLTIIEEAPPHKTPCGASFRRFSCRCDCGATVVVKLHSMRQRLTQSCGCLQREASAKNGRKNAIHGMDGTRTHKAWLSMRQRCLCRTHRYYAYYGGRGIAICHAWLNSFQAFLSDMGICPDGHSLERINNEGDYEPSNCKWATMAEQNRNHRNTVRLTWNGETLCLSQWARKRGMSRYALRHRLSRGLSVEDALTIPLNSRRNFKDGKETA